MMRKLTMTYLISLIFLVSISTSTYAVNNEISIAVTTAVNAEEVFEQYKNRLLQVRIIDIATNEKSTIGSGFYINKDGHLVTNYHVISKYVFQPEQYRIETLDHLGLTHQATVLKVDVIHDMAVLDSAAENTPFFVIEKQNSQQGARIYTMGNPLDLGMTIVEGNYNGLTDDTMHERILLSSALNRGMSGGPTITNEGNIIGINVATAGNSISFLVPEQFLIDFIRTPNVTTDKLIDNIEQQLVINQDAFLNNIVQLGLNPKPFGHFIVPGKIADYLRCWGDSTNNIVAYKKSVTLCRTNNNIYVSDEINSGEINYSHYVFDRGDINSIRFYNLIENEFVEFIQDANSFSGSSDHFSNFQCHQDFIEINSIKFKVALCLRKYNDFSDLYDLALFAVSVMDSDIALMTNLSVSGLSFDNAINISKTYLEGFQWNRQ